MAGPDIFLSYNREDAARAKQFAQAFEAEGFEVWWDAALRSGEAYDKVTETALRDARAVVVLWSPRSVESRWVRAEATEADRSNKLIPAMIEQCKRPIMFELTHTAELSHWHGNRKDPAWRAYVEDIRRMMGGRAPIATAEGGRGMPAAAARSKWIFAVIAAVVLLVGGGTWIFVRDRSQAATAGGAPVPVLIHTFTAAGSGDPTEGELASGLSDELIDRLQGIPGLRIGRGAAAATNGGSGPFANAYVVDGNVRRDGNDLRVTTQLLSHDGQVVWSHSYDRTVSDVFAMQQDIARSVAGALSVSLDVGADSARYGGTNNPDAYAAYLQFESHQLDPDQSVPLNYLNRALALDPHYVKALGSLATSYGIRSVGVSDPKKREDLLSRMDVSSRQAIALAPNLWVGYETRAWYYVHRGDLISAQRSFEKALKLNNGIDLEPIGNYTAFEIQTGRLSAAASSLAAAALIDPAAQSTDAYISIALFRGHYQEAIDRFGALPGEQQASPALALYPAWAHLLLDGEADATKFAREHGLDFEAAMRTYKANSAIETMSPAELTAWAKSSGADLGIDAGNLTLWAAYYHHPQLALELLKLSHVDGLVMWFPQMAEARKLDGFKQIVVSDGLVKLWRTTGDWGDFCKPTTGDDFTCS